MKVEHICETHWCPCGSGDGIVYVTISTWHGSIVQNMNNELEQVSWGENKFKNIKQHEWG